MDDATKSEGPKTGDPAQAAEVFYDGACPVCRREIAVYKRMAAAGDAPLSRDGAWIDVSDPAAAPDGLDRDALLRRFHVRRANGEVVSGAAAFVAVWRATPSLAWIGRIVDRQPFIAIGDVLYAGFLGVRRLWRRSA